MSEILDQWQASFETIMEERWADQNDGSHDLGHLRRVWKNCQNIHDIGYSNGKNVYKEADQLVLLAASYLHDLVNLPKDHPDRHLASRYSAEQACMILKDSGMCEDRTALIAHAIEAHSFSANLIPNTLEAKILQDADRLEAIGAIGIARCFYVSGTMSRSLFHPEDPFAKQRAPDDQRYAVDHFKLKLFPIIETLNTEGARIIAARRGKVMSSFLSALQDEIQ